MAIVSLMCQQNFIPQENSWYSFLLEAESTPPAIMLLEGFGKLKESNDLIRN
jgi:hypothetical protein